MYTKAQIARKLGVSPQTISYYVKQYGEFIPSITEEGTRHPVYPDTSFKVFETIRGLIEKEQTSTQIRNQLREKYSELYEVKDGEAIPATRHRQPKDNKPATLNVQQAGLLVDNNRLLYETSQLRQRELEEMIAQNSRLMGLLDAKNEEIATLKEELDDTKQELEMTEENLRKLKKKRFGGLF